MQPIPFLDVNAPHRALAPQIRAVLDEVFATGAFVQGARVAAFERAFAAYCGTRHCVAVASGTDALFTNLLALGAGPGDEVVTTPLTFFATAEAIRLTGARPVFADVDPDTLQLDPRAVAAAVTDRTVGILPVHLYGSPCDLGALLEIAVRRDLWVVEDACQAHGARLFERRVGALSESGCFSFYPGKNLGTCGEGGAIVTSDDELAKELRRLRDHGSVEKYTHVRVGTNARMSEIEAALLALKLPHLDDWNAARRTVAGWYAEALQDAPVQRPAPVDGAEPVHHLYVVLSDERDALRDSLAAEGIATGLHYPRPLHLQPALADLGHAPGDFPHAESAARRCLSLPMYPQLSRAQVERVATAVGLHAAAPA